MITADKPSPRVKTVRLRFITKGMESRGWSVSVGGSMGAGSGVGLISVCVPSACFLRLFGSVGEKLSEG